ncbi:hypothetical protein AB4264_24460 [Vibrio sp. 10N.261.55.B8]|uniref:hypothetical protein n=1 Tax=Vibrio sp. 10N.261.55.B8 TaxID=3229688 RepID=UPI003550C9F8
MISKITLSANAKCFNFYTDETFIFDHEFLEKLEVTIVDNVTFETNHLKSFHSNDPESLYDLAEEISLDNPDHSERAVRHSLNHAYSTLTDKYDLHVSVLNSESDEHLIYGDTLDLHSLNQNEFERFIESFQKAPISNKLFCSI